MKKFLLLVSLLLIQHLVVSQSAFRPLATDSVTYFIRTFNGKEFIGKIIEETDSSFTVRIFNNGGESFVLIPKKEAKETKIVQPGDLVNGQYWGTIPNISYTIVCSNCRSHKYVIVKKFPNLHFFLI